MTLHAGQGIHLPSESTRLRRENEQLRKALEESVGLQSHYAVLLNNYDGGRRLAFKSAEEWLTRLKELGR